MNKHETLSIGTIKGTQQEREKILVAQLREKFGDDALKTIRIIFDIIECSVKSLNKQTEQMVKKYPEKYKCKSVSYLKFASFCDVLENIKKNQTLTKTTFNEPIENEQIQRIIIENVMSTQILIGNHEVLKNNLPNNYYITNNKLSNEITREFLNNGEFSLAVINPNRKGEVCTYNSLSYEGEDISITGSQQFTAYDRTVHNAVCSLFVADNTLITPQMIYRTFNGMTEGEYISPQAIGAVTKSIDKSRFTRLKVDFTQEAKARNLNIDNAIIDSNLLYAESIIITTGGVKKHGYKILKTPALYEYAHLTKQIISVPLSLLDTRDATRNTEEIIPIKEYLIRRIEIMKNNKVSNKILYETIFSEININLTSQSQKNRMRNYIVSILALWQKRDKYIKSFNEYKEGKNYKGIEIIN